MGDDVQSRLGALEARLDSQEKRLDRIDTNVQKLLEYAAGTRGGWFAIATAGTLGAGIFAGLMKLVTMVKGGG